MLCGVHKGWPSLLSIVKLALRYWLEGRSQYTHLDTTAIVCNLEQFQPTFLGKDIEGCSTGIDGILNELFERMYRSHNDFTGRNFVDYIWVECLSPVSGLNQAQQRSACVRRCRELPRFGPTLILRGAPDPSDNLSAFLFVPLGTTL